MSLSTKTKKTTAINNKKYSKPTNKQNYAKFSTLLMPDLNPEQHSFIEGNIYKLKAGSDAELFVMEFEKKRLCLEMTKYIEQHSSRNRSMGYDILSFKDKNSREHRILIEVKSYKNKKVFFFTKGEMKVAKIAGQNYYLYLVDRSQIGNPNYKPEIIQNPYEKIIKNSSVKKEIDRYKITYK